jgi:hypothetical protein
MRLRLHRFNSSSEAVSKTAGYTQSPSGLRHNYMTAFHDVGCRLVNLDSLPCMGHTQNYRIPMQIRYEFPNYTSLQIV